MSVPVDVLAELRRQGVTGNVYYAVVEFVESSRQAEQFIDYLLTHAPEVPDENGTVMRLRAALAHAGSRPEVAPWSH